LDLTRGFELIRRIVSAFAAGVALAVLASSCSPGSGKTRPHVLLLTVDTLRYDHVSGASHGQPTMPFVDSLLESGFRFSRASTPIPRTTPALASLMTGSYPRTHQLRELFGTLGEGVTPLAEILRSNGYDTHAVISNATVSAGRGLDRGFAVYDHSGLTEQGAVQTTDRLIQSLKARNSTEPVFAWVLYIDPHVPYFPPRELAQSFDPHYTGRYRWNFGGRGLADQAYPKDLGKAKAVFRNDLPERVNDHIRRLYAADIRHTDDQIRRLVSWLRENIGGEWLIVFTSDHGESLGEHDFFYDHGDYVYDATLRVPLGIVLDETHSAHGAGVIDAQVSLIDVMPTVLALLGVEAPSDPIEGRSLVPYLRGDSLPERPVFAESGTSYYPEHVKRRVRFDLSGRFRAASLGDWKLIWTPGRPQADAFELYDLAADPGETENLYAPDHPQVATLKRQLHEWMARGGSAGAEGAALSKLDRRALCSLGYIECE
jgi:arylsulfatase A-like enzyme